MSLQNTFWNQKFFHNLACNLVVSNSLCRTFFLVALCVCVCVCLSVCVCVFLCAIYVKTVKELKRPSTSERRVESVRLTDASFKSEFMFVEFWVGFIRIRHAISYERPTAVRNSRKVVTTMTERPETLHYLRCTTTHSLDIKMWPVGVTLLMNEDSSTGVCEGVTELTVHWSVL
jgi:hypothetical protein